MEREKDYVYLSTRKALFLMTEAVFDSVSYSDRWLEKDPDYIMISDNELVDFYNKLDNKRKPFRKLLLLYLKNPGLFRSIVIEVRKKIDSATKSLKRIDLRTISNEELERIFKIYSETYVFVIRFPNVLRKLDHALFPYLRENLKMLTSHDITLLSYPKKQSEAIQEHIAIAKASMKGNPERQARILWSKFAQIPMGFHEERPRSLDFYIKEMKKLEKIAGKDIRRIKEEEKHHLALWRKAAKKVPKRFSSIKVAFREMPYLKDYIKMRVQEANFIFMPMFEEISRRFRISLYDIHRLSRDEIINMIRIGKYSKELVEKRKSLYVNMQLGKRKQLYGERARKFIKIFEMEGQQMGFSGRTASRGYGKGAAKIIRSSEDFHKFKKGDIIVANNTTPDFVPIIKKAAAIVAEEGGITAHVSVVSREFRVPCIVGIKGATKIFKDGDILEVDATKGTIKKL
jgi:phosphohistidine swiveling domain-containing protein